MKQEEKLCQQHTVLHVFSIRPSGLCHSYCDPLPNTPQKKKKKKGEWRKRIQQCFFPACWKWAQSCQEEVCRPFPGAEEWRGSYATWGRYGGRSRGFRWVLASSVWTDLWSSHTDGDWLVCPSHLQPCRPLVLISSVQNTQLYTARLFLPTSNSDSSQITAEDIGRCASMLCNMSDRDSSWWNRRKKIASESEKELFTLFRGLRNVHINYDNQMFRHAKPASGC